jgi:hypothetical protein
MGSHETVRIGTTGWPCESGQVGAHREGTGGRYVRCCPPVLQSNQPTSSAGACGEFA